MRDKTPEKFLESLKEAMGMIAKGILK